MLISPAEEPRDRLIVALDVATKEEAQSVVDDLEGVVAFYKVGYQLFIAEGMPFVRSLLERNKRIFLDLKMDDVEETITSAVREITRNQVNLLTLHGDGATARAAVAGRGGSTNPRILSVTLLSSLNEQDLIDRQILTAAGKFKSLMDYVLWRAESAVAAGCDGLIVSGGTVAEVRKRVGENPILVTPGVRPAGATTDDHKRSLTPRDAIVAGADYLVVGRPIRDAANRRAMAERIVDEIDSASTTGANP